MVAFESRKEAMAHMHDIVRDLNACISHDKGLARVSPLVLDAVYSTGITDLWWREQSGASVPTTSPETVKEGLLRISARWGVAGEYLGLLEQHETTTISSSGFSMPIVSMPMVPSTPMGI